jgi:Uma2 family endonuclease
MPTMYDLPSESPEEPGLPDEFHLWQAELCSATFRPPTYPPEQILVASDLNLYYDPTHTGWYKRPDWFAVVGVPRLYEERDLRLSYVLWQEGMRPIVAIEFLSPGTRDEDLGQRQQRGPQPTKWQVYEQILGIPYYIVFDRYTDELQVFQLEGNRYQPLSSVESRIWLPCLSIGIGLWQGKYRGLNRQWLRWYDARGNWICLEAELERQRAVTIGGAATAGRNRSERDLDGKSDPPSTLGLEESSIFEIESFSSLMLSPLMPKLNSIKLNFSLISNRKI